MHYALWTAVQMPFSLKCPVAIVAYRPILVSFVGLFAILCSKPKNKRKEENLKNKKTKTNNLLLPQDKGSQVSKDYIHDVR